MKNPFNTIFGRVVLTSIGLLVLAFVISVFVFGREANMRHAAHEYRDLQLVEQTRRDGIDTTKRVAAALGIRYLDEKEAALNGAPLSRADTCGLFENALREDLPAGSQVASTGGAGTIWVRYAGDKNWMLIPDAIVPEDRVRSALAMMLVLAIIIASIVAWIAQRPLLRLANAVREFRVGGGIPVVKVSGPREVADLIVGFNEMVRQIGEYEHERAMILAGVAHDLRTPLTRMQVRSDLLPDGADRIGFLGDVESLGRIVTQFLDFVRDRADGSPLVPVDAFCLRQYGSVPRDEDTDHSLVVLDLRAGSQFRLPLVDLDRILANLLENAMSYGEPPVEISTSAEHGNFTMTLRDHGPGILDEQIDHAMQPFARLDTARGGDAHAGLGLSIVRRLVHRNGGAFSANNAVDGGLRLSLVFPERGG